MTPAVALQLYTVRRELGRDAGATLRRVAEAGYRGVEPFGLDPAGARALRIVLDDLGLEVPSVHVAPPLGEAAEEAFEVAAALGAPRIVSGFGPDAFAERALVRESCARFAEASAAAGARGLAFGIHNHWWEFEPVEGELPYRTLLATLPPEVFFELDLYWAATAGAEPTEVLRELGSRAPLLHVKDGPARRDEPMVALGEGNLDLPAALSAAEAAEWLIVELDECAGDMLEAVEASARYLIGGGYGRGRD